MLSDPSSCKNIRSAGYCGKDGTCEPLENFSFVSVCLFPEEEEAARCRQAGHQWDSILFSGGTMEPEGRPLTPGTSYGPPPFNSAQNPSTPDFLNCTLQVRHPQTRRYHCMGRLVCSDGPHSRIRLAQM